MTYKNDPLLPILQTEIANRTSAYANLSAEEEAKLLSLSDENKKVIASSDRRAKEEFLKSAPSINNPGVRMHEKYANYVKSVGGH